MSQTVRCFLQNVLPKAFLISRTALRKGSIHRCDDPQNFFCQRSAKASFSKGRVEQLALIGRRLRRLIRVNNVKMSFTKAALPQKRAPTYGVTCPDRQNGR